MKYETGLDEFESWKQGYKRKLIIVTAPQIASSMSCHLYYGILWIKIPILMF